MKKVILLLMAIMPFIMSCQKQETTTDVRGTKWNHNICDGNGMVSLKYMLYLNNDGKGKYEVYNMNRLTDKLEIESTVDYKQLGNNVRLKLIINSSEYMTIYYRLQNNNLIIDHDGENNTVIIDTPAKFSYLGKI